MSDQDVILSRLILDNVTDIYEDHPVIEKTEEI